MAEWIPISERLPEEHQPVLVTFTTDGISTVVQCHFENGKFRFCIGVWKTYNVNHDVPASCVAAWMPLPEPYRGDEE